MRFLAAHANSRAMTLRHAIALVLLFGSLTAHAAEDTATADSAPAPATIEAPRDAEPAKRPARRALRVSMSYMNTFLNPFPGKSTSGIGPSGTYELAFTPNFIVGIHMAYRWFLSNPGFRWWGYGFMLKHYLANERETPGLRPYLEYGLLVASIRTSEFDSYGLAHDTRLTIGTDISLGKNVDFLFARDTVLFVDATYHLCWLGYFNTPSINLMAAELNLGVRFKF